MAYGRSEVDMRRWLIYASLILSLASAWPADASRIKDIAYINGLRPNQLIGYGLVVGLDNTGDRRTTIFTNQSLTNMLEKMGIRVDPNLIKVNNVAAVMVTCDLPPF